MVQEDIVTVPDVALFSDNVKLGEPTEVVHPVMRSGVPDAENSYQDCNVGSTEGQISFDVSQEERQLALGDYEAIVVGAVGSGAPSFLTGWAKGTEVEFRIDTGCQVTILATSVFEQMCVSDHRI